MTQRDAAFLGCRLMAVWYAIGGLIQLPFAVAYWIVSRRLLGPEAKGPAIEMLMDTMTLLVPVFHVVAGMFLFYGAGFLSRMLSAEPGEPIAAISQKGLLRVGSLLIALSVAADYLPGLFDKIYRQVTSDTPPLPDSPTIAVNVVGIALAIGILLWAILRVKRDTLSHRQNGDEGDREVGG